MQTLFVLLTYFNGSKMGELLHVSSLPQIKYCTKRVLKQVLCNNHQDEIMLNNGYSFRNASNTIKTFTV